MKTKIFTCFILLVLLTGSHVFSQTTNEFDVTKVYYIKYKGYALADDKTGLGESGQYTGDELFAGDEYLKLKTYKEGSWSQMWILKHGGDSYELVNYSTNRSIWAGRRIPVTGTKWNDKNWQANSAITLRNAYVGATSGGDVGLGSWNKFKLIKDGNDKYKIFHVWWNETDMASEWAGYMAPSAESSDAPVTFDKTISSYDFEIVEAMVIDAFVPYDTDLGDFVKPTFDANKRYYVKINGLALTDDKTGLGESKVFSDADVFTGNENLRAKAFTENSYSQMWKLEPDGGEWMIVNHSTNRSCWSTQNIPKIGTTWVAKDWQARPASMLDCKVYMGHPSGPDAGRGGFNRFKIRKKNTIDNLYSIVPSFSTGSTPGWDGAMNVLDDTQNAIVGFTGKAVFNFQIIEAADISNMPADADDTGGTTGENLIQGDLLFHISGKTITANEPFSIYNSLGELISARVVQFNAENAGIYLIIAESTRKVQKIFIR